MRFYAVLSQSIESDWCECPSALKLFQCYSEPRVSLRYYLQRIERYVQPEDSIKVCALWYIRRVQGIVGQNIPYLCIHRVVLMCFCVAVKMWNDTCSRVSNTYFARVGGISLQEFNRLELELLRLLNFDLWVDSSSYNEMLLLIK